MLVFLRKHLFNFTKEFVVPATNMFPGHHRLVLISSAAVLLQATTSFAGLNFYIRDASETLSWPVWLCTFLSFGLVGLSAALAAFVRNLDDLAVVWRASVIGLVLSCGLHLVTSPDDSSQTLEYRPPI